MEQIQNPIKNLPISREEKWSLAGKLYGGRPKGSLSKVTKLKNKTYERIEVTVAKMADKIISAQAMQAVGTHKMLRIYFDEVTGNKRTQVIRDIGEIEKLIESGIYGQDYIIVEGREADFRAGNALLDRVFGKAKEHLNIDANVKFSLVDLARKAEMIENSQEEI